MEGGVMRNQIPPLSVEATDALMGLGQLTRSTFAEVGRLLGQPAQQMQALCQLIDGPRTMTRLAARLGMTRSSATELIDRIEVRGLVTRHSDQTDRRLQYVALTKEGTQFADRAHEVVTGKLSAAMASLTITERSHLTTLISKLLANVDEARVTPM